MLLVTAIQVEAFWSRPFQEQDVPFNNYGSLDEHVSETVGLLGSDMNGKLVTFAESGSTKARRFEELSEFHFRAISLRHKGSVTFTILEPLNHEEGNGIKQLATELFAGEFATSQMLKKVMESVNSGPSVVFSTLKLPRFR